MSVLPAESGHQSHVPSGQLWADCVEKVLPDVGTNFLRAAGALGVLGRGGPLPLEQIHSAAFPHTVRGNRQPKSAQLAFARILLTRHFDVLLGLERT